VHLFHQTTWLFLRLLALELVLASGFRMLITGGLQLILMRLQATLATVRLAQTSAATAAPLLIVQLVALTSGATLVFCAWETLLAALDSTP
jgi:hypothetical protein